MVDIGDEYAFFEVIEYDDPRTAADSTEGARPRCGNWSGKSGVVLPCARAEGHDEQPRAPIFSHLHIADNGALAY